MMNYYCIYCKEQHDVDKFTELYPNCYYNQYAKEPEVIDFNEYLMRLSQIGFAAGGSCEVTA